MSTSGSPADTPEFALPAAANAGSENTVASASINSILTDRRSDRSGVSQTLSWSVTQQNQQTVGAPANVPPMEISERSRPNKRHDHSRSPTTSKSPRRNTEARGSDQPLTAGQRLDQWIAGSHRQGYLGGRTFSGSKPPRIITFTISGKSLDCCSNEITSKGNDENTSDYPTKYCR